MIRTAYRAYLPSLYRETAEFSALADIFDDALDTMNETLDAMMNGAFLDTCDESYLSRHEKIMGLLPVTGESIAVRRQCLAMRTLDKIPFTFAALKSILSTILGKNNVQIWMDPSEYTLEIYVNLEGALREELKSMLDKMLPANMTYSIAPLS